MSVIQSISYRKVLNSHVKFTNEFVIRLADGSSGHAASPQGETISIYEDKKPSSDPQSIIQAISNNGLMGKEVNQEQFDDFLQQHTGQFGRNNTFALSEAFFNAQSGSQSPFEIFGIPEQKLNPPRLCLNILNGGWHAYTNPVLCDFPEIMLVARSTDANEVIGEHNEIQHAVREHQLQQSKTVISGNPVNRFDRCDNQSPIEFLLNTVDKVGLSGKYDLMIDASASDLWGGSHYALDVTGGQACSSEQFTEYWLDIIRQYPLRFLEDPFHEQDYQSWQALTTAQQKTLIIGDNLYSSDEARIAEGAGKQLTHGAVIKLNQAGTITAARKAVDAALSAGQIPITSHRSISTESTFLSLLTCLFGAPYIKIGPLQSDYSSVMRLNEIIRLTDGYHAL